MISAFGETSEWVNDFGTDDVLRNFAFGGGISHEGLSFFVKRQLLNAVFGACFFLTCKLVSNL